MKILACFPEKWRARLDQWPFWMGLAYFGLVALMVWLFFVAQHTSQVQADQARNQAIRMAEIRAAAESAYRRCTESIGPTQRISTHVAGVNDAFNVILENSRDALAVTPHDDPVYRVRVASLARLSAAIRKVAAVKAFPVPTRQECRERRREALRSAGG